MFLSVFSHPLMTWLLRKQLGGLYWRTVCFEIGVNILPVMFGMVFYVSSHSQTFTLRGTALPFAWMTWHNHLRWWSIEREVHYSPQYSATLRGLMKLWTGAERGNIATPPFYYKEEVGQRYHSGAHHMHATAAGGERSRSVFPAGCFFSAGLRGGLTFRFWGA